MKKILYIVLFTVLALQGCNTESVDSMSKLTKSTIRIVTEIDDTRTYLEDDNKIHWAESGEQLNIIYYSDNNSSEISQTPTHADYTIESDGRIIFSADITTVEGAASHTLGAFYPYQHVAQSSSVVLTIPQAQSPTAESYDPKSDILVSKEPIVIEGDVEGIKVSLSRMVAFAKMTLKGIGAGEIIEKVIFSSSAKPAGSVEFKVHEAATVENAVWYNEYEDIEITRENWVATGEDVVWMTTVPTDLSGTDFTVTVVTDKHSYTKSVDLTSRTLDFKRGDIATFSVTLEPTLDLSGSWKLTEWRGVKPSFEVYMQIDQNNNVTMWQRITSREWERYQSEATIVSGVISGIYSDGIEWRASYNVTIDGDSMTWTDTTDATDISVYSRVELPEELPQSSSTTQTSATRAVSERFL